MAPEAVAIFGLSLTYIASAGSRRRDFEGHTMTEIKSPWHQWLESVDPENLFNEEEKKIAKIEIAWAKAALFFRTDEEKSKLIETRRLLDVFKKRNEKGETMALLHAISLCAEENLPLPEWLALAFRDKLNQFLLPSKAKERPSPASLDEVFKSSNLPTNTKQNKECATKDWQKGVEIFNDVWREAPNHSSLASALAAVLKNNDYAIGKTKARQLVEMIDRNQSELRGKPYDSLENYFKRKKKNK
jgi:hypothetical protein